MVTVNTDELKRIQGLFQAKYGEVLDPSTAMLLNEVMELKKNGHNKNERMLESIFIEIKNMKSVYKPFSTSDPKIAFLHGLGKITWAWLSVVVIALAVIQYHQRETTKFEYLMAKKIGEKYPNLVKLESLIENAKIVESKEGLFLEVQPAKKKLVLGNTYVVDPKISMNEKAPAILIPLKFK